VDHGRAARTARARTRPRSATRGATVLLMAVLALDYADRGLLGGVAPALRDQFGVTNTQLGALAGAFGAVAGVATIPAGVLTDRVRRTALLAASIALWSAAMAATGAATTFTTLLGARLALGVVTATAGPAVISLAGDLFGRRERARRLGAVQGGELAGSGAGLLLGGALAAVATWRAGFWLLAGAGLAVATTVARFPEPARTRPRGAADERDRDRELPLRRAVVRVLRVRTNVVVLVADSLGNLFFAGVRTFALVFVTSFYGVSQGAATAIVPVIGAGALAGVLGGGRVADRLLARGRPDARLLVAAVGYLGTALVAIPAFVIPSLAPALPLYVVAACLLAAPSPPLGAVRLDVMPPGLWGRAEGVRTLLRVATESSAPLLFGLLADHLAADRAEGLQRAFLVSLPAVGLAGIVLLLARRAYVREAGASGASGGPGGARGRLRHTEEMQHGAREGT
jgi:predicted MFS family arabinose efflux permease